MKMIGSRFVKSNLIEHGSSPFLTNAHDLLIEGFFPFPPEGWKASLKLAMIRSRIFHD